jgi:hypothetical protein
MKHVGKEEEEDEKRRRRRRRRRMVGTRLGADYVAPSKNAPRLWSGDDFIAVQNASRLETLNTTNRCPYSTFDFQ